VRRLAAVRCLDENAPLRILLDPGVLELAADPIEKFVRVLALQGRIVSVRPYAA
jgi:hypothetical protein